MPLKYLHWFIKFKFNFDVAKTTLIFLAECNGMAHKEYGMRAYRLTTSPLPSSPPTLPPLPSPKPNKKPTTYKWLQFKEASLMLLN